MVDVVYEDGAIEKSKIDAITLERARRKMIANPDPTRPKKGGKWLEMVILPECRIAMSCKKEDDDIVITNAALRTHKQVKKRSF